MKPTKPNGDDAAENSNQNQMNQMSGPEAAAKRDVEEAERKAEQAGSKAEAAQEMATMEAERVHDDLREDIEELQEHVAMIDQLLNKVYELDDGVLNSEMPHVVPSNRDPEDQGMSFEEVAADE